MCRCRVRVRLRCWIDSISMTSAPRSARITVVVGPAHARPWARTRTPANGGLRLFIASALRYLDHVLGAQRGYFRWLVAELAEDLDVVLPQQWRAAQLPGRTGKPQRQPGQLDR